MQNKPDAPNSGGLPDKAIWQAPISPKPHAYKICKNRLANHPAQYAQKPKNTLWSCPKPMHHKDTKIAFTPNALNHRPRHNSPPNPIYKKHIKIAFRPDALNVNRRVYRTPKAANGFIFVYSLPWSGRITFNWRYLSVARNRFERRTVAAILIDIRLIRRILAAGSL